MNFARSIYRVVGSFLNSWLEVTWNQLLNKSHVQGQQWIKNIMNTEYRAPTISTSSFQCYLLFTSSLQACTACDHTSGFKLQVSVKHVETTEDETSIFFLTSTTGRVNSFGKVVPRDRSRILRSRHASNLAQYVWVFLLQQFRTYGLSSVRLADMISAYLIFSKNTELTDAKNRYRVVNFTILRMPHSNFWKPAGSSKGRRVGGCRQTVQPGNP